MVKIKNVEEDNGLDNGPDVESAEGDKAKGKGKGKVRDVDVGVAWPTRRSARGIGKQYVIHI